MSLVGLCIYRSIGLDALTCNLPYVPVQSAFPYSLPQSHGLKGAGSIIVADLLVLAKPSSLVMLNEGTKLIAGVFGHLKLLTTPEEEAIRLVK